MAEPVLNLSISGKNRQLKQLVGKNGYICNCSPAGAFPSDNLRNNKKMNRQTTHVSKRVVLPILFILAGFQLIQAQNGVVSEYFKNPQLMVKYADSCARFWTKVHDPEYDGFYVEVGRQGNVLDNNKKSIVCESRDAYGFSRVFMLTGNRIYLDMAASAIRFMRDHLYDTQYGGWFTRCDRTGNNPYTGSKTAFDHHYALLGLMANYEATGDTAVLHLLQKGYQFDESRFWDADSLHYGYYTTVNRDGSNGTGKSFNATVDAVTTHLYNLYLITGDEKYAKRLTLMAQNMLDYLYGNMASQVIGFPEDFNTSWVINAGDKRTIMGHVLKTGWCLARIYKIDPRPEYLQASKQLVDHVLEKGYDHVNGGPYKDYDRTTGAMMMYGAYDKAKAWWQVEQAITSGLLLFEITEDGKYLKMADESLDFFMHYFVDAQYGEVFADRSETGGRVYYSGGYWDENKGSESKAAYHSIETAYYSYMYGNLIINNQPFTLNYYYTPMDSVRVVRMNPLAVDFEHFKISSVTLDGSAYTNFDPDSRLLTIPAQTGGLYAVTYKSTKTYVAGLTEVPAANASLKLDVSPNPVVDLASFRMYLPQAGAVSLSICDLNGMIIYQVNSKFSTAGNHTMEWNAATCPRGLYIIRLVSGNQVLTAKMVVSK